MTIGEMFNQSGILALSGMATVFGFLFLLVICITVTGKIIHAFGMDTDLGAGAAAAARQAAVFTPSHLGASGIDGAVVSAITSAVKEYRKE